MREQTWQREEDEERKEKKTKENQRKWKKISKKINTLLKKFRSVYNEAKEDFKKTNIEKINKKENIQSVRREGK